MNDPEERKGGFFIIFVEAITLRRAETAREGRVAIPKDMTDWREEPRGTS